MFIVNTQLILRPGKTTFRSHLKQSRRMFLILYHKTRATICIQYTKIKPRLVISLLSRSMEPSQTLHYVPLSGISKAISPS